MSAIHAYAARAPKGPLQAFEFDPGELMPDDVEIKVTHCGICHSDLSMLDNEWGMSQFPLVPGHEAVGTVLALGKNAKGLQVGQRVGVGWSASSCLHCRECLSGHHNLCANGQGTIVGRHGGFADRLRAQWTWVRPIPDALDLAKAGPLFCGGVTVFNPFLAYNISPTARVGVIGVGGLGHMALQFASKWGCEVHAFTTSDSKEMEARRLGAHVVHNTKQEGALKKIAGSLDLIISTINVPLDVPGLLEALAPLGRLHVVGAVLEPLSVPAFGMIMGQKAISGSPVGSPTAIDRMLEFSARHSVAPVVETFPMSKVNDALEHLRAGKARYRIVLEAWPLIYAATCTGHIMKTTTNAIDANKELVLAGIKGVFIDRDPAVLDRLFSDDYRQHNPQIPNGTAAIKALLRNLPADFKYEPGLVVADGDYVTIHGRYIGWGPKPMVAVDIFRVANGRIAEHWDVMQEEVPAAQSASGNSMLTTQE